jgi:hypothetical protein
MPWEIRSIDGLSNATNRLLPLPVPVPTPLRVVFVRLTSPASNSTVKILHSILVYAIQRMAVIEPAISSILSMIEGKRKSKYVIKADICCSTTAILV